MGISTTAAEVIATIQGMKYRNVINLRLNRVKDTAPGPAKRYAVGDMVRLVDGGYLRIETVDPLDPAMVHGYLSAPGSWGYFASVAHQEIAEHIACEWPRRLPHAQPSSLH